MPHALPQHPFPGVNAALTETESLRKMLFQRYEGGRVKKLTFNTDCQKVFINIPFFKIFFEYFTLNYLPGNVYFKIQNIF